MGAHQKNIYIQQMSKLNLHHSMGYTQPSGRVSTKSWDIVFFRPLLSPLSTRGLRTGSSLALDNAPLIITNQHIDKEGVGARHTILKQLMRGPYRGAFTFHWFGQQLAGKQGKHFQELFRLCPHIWNSVSFHYCDTMKSYKMRKLKLKLKK